MESLDFVPRAAGKHGGVLAESNTLIYNISSPWSLCGEGLQGRRREAVVPFLTPLHSVEGARPGQDRGGPG